MTKSKRLELFRQIMWDSSLTPEEVMQVFDGDQSEVPNINKSALFRRLLESYPWYTLLELFPNHQLASLLTEEVISKLRSESLKRQYAYARKRLQSLI